jgi:hypothetical protein
VAIFIDATGETWTIEISVDEIRVLRKEITVDLLSLLDNNGALLRKLAADPLTLVDVISILCTDQIKRRDLDERGFAKRLVGHGLEAALDCLIEAIANFTPPRQGAVIRQMWAKTRELDQRAMDRLSTKLASPDLARQLDEKMEALLKEAGS